MAPDEIRACKHFSVSVVVFIGLRIATHSMSLLGQGLEWRRACQYVPASNSAYF